MAELDLVPTDYRQSLRLRGWLRTFAVVQLGLLLALAGVKLGVDVTERARRRAIEEIHAAELKVREQRGRLDQLRSEEQVAQRRLSILAGLRGGISSDALFLTVDRAFEEGIWFLDWSFRRAGHLVDDDPKAVQTGYFLVVPLDQEADQPKKAWRLETHMEIRGQAVDHSALARFVDRLIDEPRIEQVRIVKTRMQTYAAARVLDFELAVVVRTDA